METMQVLSNEQIRAWDEYTIQHEPISSLALMERAANACWDKLSLFPPHRAIAIFCGMGNNGGDGLAIARLAFLAGRNVSVYICKIKEKGSADFEANLQQLPLNAHWIEKQSQLPELPKGTIIIDALLGTGQKLPLPNFLQSLVEYLNGLHCHKIAIDMPTGNLLAHETYTFQVYKEAMLFEETGAGAGRISVLDIGLHPSFLKQIPQGNWYFNDVIKIKNPSHLNRFSMKWQKGSALIVGGSYGMAGAMLLSSKACLKAGAGLVTAYLPKTAYTIFQTALPEVMVQTDEELYEIRNLPSRLNYQAIAIGMGMGRHPYTVKALLNWIPSLKVPMVIDADALNALAAGKQMGKPLAFPPDCVITPHSKEFDRLFGTHTNSKERVLTQIEVSKQYQITIVLKGAFTSISSPRGELWFNTNGTPLLATAGSGDVLSGIIASLLAQGYSCIEAARKGVHLHAALANRLEEKGFKQATASDLINELPFV